MIQMEILMVSRKLAQENGKLFSYAYCILAVSYSSSNIKLNNVCCMLVMVRVFRCFKSFICLNLLPFHRSV